ncbi:MAG: holo-ACP synthase [Nitrospira sp.]|nr:holo-ACP synthase [Candidatus Manganitrophaceae bacterium]HIL34519.1 holo-ACP synthase [Candidatus Manganitrophaceae bacterium]
MSIVGIGIDLVKISRLEEITQRWGDRFLNRVFTPSERDYCLQHKRPHIHFSARFAVKEAALKALGTGLREGIRWKDVETVNDPNGKPELRMYGKTRRLAEAQKVSKVFTSMTHDHDYAIAQVILEQNG